MQVRSPAPVDDSDRRIGPDPVESKSRLTGRAKPAPPALFLSVFSSLLVFVAVDVAASAATFVRFPRACQLFIKTLTGRKQAFNFEPENQVLSVKQALQEKEGIQVDQIRLIYSGKQLADDKPLEFYNIQAGGTIHMVLQLRGGGGAP